MHRCCRNIERIGVTLFGLLDQLPGSAPTKLASCETAETGVTIACVTIDAEMQRIVGRLHNAEAVPIDLGPVIRRVRRTHAMQSCRDEEPRRRKQSAWREPIRAETASSSTQAASPNGSS
jgi:hypothetical protein